MALKLYPEENIQSIASAIRTKNGLSTSYTTSQMAQAIIDIPSGDVSATLDAMLYNTTLNSASTLLSIIDDPRTNYSYRSTYYLSNYLFTGKYGGGNGTSNYRKVYIPELTMIGRGAFAEISGQWDLSFPSCSNISGWAFAGANFINGSSNHLVFPSLSSMETKVFAGYGLYGFISGTTYRAHQNVNPGTIELPLLSSVTTQCFYGRFISNVILPEATVIGQQAFKETGEYYNGNYYGLSFISLPKAESFYTEAFANNTALLSVYAPNLSRIGTSAFCSCYNLSSVTMSTVKIIETSAFYSCSNFGPSISLPVCESIGTSAFYGCSSLEYVDAPAVTSIGDGAFTSCKNIKSLKLNGLKVLSGGALFAPYGGSYSLLSTLELSALEKVSANGIIVRDTSIPALISLNLPSLLSIEPSYSQRYVFGYMPNLTSISFPALTTIKSAQYMFYNTNSLSVVSFPELLTVTGYSIFHTSNHITEVYAPKCSTYIPGIRLLSATLSKINFEGMASIYDYGFSGLSLVSDFYLPSMSQLISYMFNSCSAAERIWMPNVSTTGYASTNYLCMSCHNVSTVLLGNNTASISTIGVSAFYRCSNLLSLYLLCNNRATLANVSVFLYSPISMYYESLGRYGSIYVPASLYDSYITSTNWVRYSDRFVSMTDSEIAALLNS